MSHTLSRLLRSCKTGYGCRSTINPKELGGLRRDGRWRNVAEAIIRLDAIHPRARDCFLEAWVGGTWMGIHLDDCLDQDLFVAFLRKVLPSYLDFDTLLFRGQVRGPAGMSWTRSPQVALKFALFGAEDIDPIDAALGEAAGCAEGVILAAIVPAANIISAPCLHFDGKGQGEYIVDPRGLEFSIEPATEAVVWIREHAAAVLKRTLAEVGIVHLA